MNYVYILINGGFVLVTACIFEYELLPLNFDHYE